MTRTRLFLCLFIFGCISASAQQPLPGNIIPASRLVPFQQIRTYLALTDDQFTRLIQNLTDYSQLFSQRQQRMFQVQSEIRDETAKSPLDPAALGIRYAEIETICRNVRDEGAAVQTRNLTLITDAQKVKLKALDDAHISANRFDFRIANAEPCRIQRTLRCLVPNLRQHLEHSLLPLRDKLAVTCEILD